MGNLRDIKRKARRDLHQVMSVASLYIAAPGDPGVPISVRVHTKFDALGMQGAESGLAARRESKPKLIFMRDELVAAGIVLKSQSKAIISVEPGEAYRLDNLDAPDDITLTVYVTALEKEKTVDLPVPEVV